MRLIFTGDVAMDVNFGEEVVVEEELLRIFKNAITFINLECPLCSICEKLSEDKVILQGDVEHLKKLFKKINVKIVSLANNHIFDCGVSGFLETLEILKDMNIQYTGAGLNLEEARKPAIIELEGKRIGFLAYSWTKEMAKPSPEATSTMWGVAPIRRDVILNDVKQLKKIVDVCVVSLHWGEENTLFPPPSLPFLAKSILREGADIIIGHHPHILQGVDICKKGAIFYSLGNFYFSPYYYFEDGKPKIKKWRLKNYISGIGIWSHHICELLTVWQEGNTIKLWKNKKIKEKMRFLGKIYNEFWYPVIYPFLRRTEEMIYSIQAAYDTWKVYFAEGGFFYAWNSFWRKDMKRVMQKTMWFFKKRRKL